MQTQTVSSPHWKNVAETLLNPLIQSRRIGLVTDMDGTISHIAETPEAAVVTPRNRELLGTLVLMLPLVAAISERAVRDLQSRIAIPGMIYIGNHGLEHWVNGGRVLNENVRQYRRALTAALDEIRPYLTVGMWIEDKYATASLHYRFTPEPEQAARDLAPVVRQVCQTHGLELKPGKRLFEIRPPVTTNKGTVLLKLVEENQLDAVLYIGDDTTDVEALKAIQQLRQNKSCYAVGIGVLHEGSPCADKIRELADAVGHSVNDIEEMLSWLLKALSQKHNSAV